jgi:hypothetical protein
MKELIRHILREHTKEIGEQKVVWTYDKTKEFAKQFPSRSAMKYASISAYDRARTEGWLDDFFPPKSKEDKQKEEYDRVKKESQKYKSRDDFHKGSPWLYNVARTKGWLDELIPLPEKKYNQSSTEEFIKKAKKVHGNKYEYDKVNYVQARKPVIVTCPEHGDFPITPDNLLRNKGCKECGNIARAKSQSSNTEEFVSKSKQIHGNKYDYSKVEYINNTTPVEIICPIHKSFFQSPQNHLANKGCAKCNESHGEKFVSNLLTSNKINFTTQHKFVDCTNKSKNGYCRKLPFDFYIPELNTCIEYDGQQHFEPLNIFGGNETFENQKKRDKIKNQYCKKNGIKLIRIPYTMKKEEIEPYILKELGIK